MTQMILTEGGYQTIVTVEVGDKVVAYDPLSGVRMLNTIEKVEWISKQDYQECNAPQGYNDGEEPPTLKPEDVPFLFYVVNDKYTLFQDQSIWYERDGEINICHAKDIETGDTLFSDYDQPIEVTTVRTADGAGWWRFAISGDHSYVVDGLTLHNASRFWVGGGSANTWAATANTNWSASSGGSNNATVPGSSDSVTFDSASGSSNSVISANITILNMDCASGTGNYAGTLTHNTSVTLTCNTAGTFRFSAGMTYTAASSTAIVTFTHTSGTMTLTSNGKNFGSFTINGAGGTTTLADALAVSAGAPNTTLTLTAGTLDANTNTATINTTALASTNSNTRALSLGGNITVGTGFNATGTVWNTATVTGFTFTKNSGNVVIAALSGNGLLIGLSSGALTFNNLVLTANSTNCILQLNLASGVVFSGLTYASGWSFSFLSQVTVTFGAFNINATPLLPCAITYTASGSACVFSVTSGTCSFNWVVITQVNFSGGATFTAKNSLSAGGLNTGITITPPGMGPTTEVIPQRAFKAGATSQSIDIFIQDGSSIGGNGLTGLVYNASGLIAYYRKGATGTATSITLATQTVGGAYSSGGLVEIDAAHTPGMYRFDIPDTVLASAGGATVYLQGATNMVPCIVSLEIVAYDPTNATTLGLTNLDAQVSTRLPTTSITLNTGAVTVGTNNDKTGYSLSVAPPTSTAIATAVWGDTTAGDFTISASVGKSVMNGVALGTGLTVNALTTNNDKTGYTASTVGDKTGYSLSQAFPSNFSSFAITAGGAVTAGTVSDKTGYSLTQAFPTNFSSLSIDSGGNAAITSNIKKNTAKAGFLFVMTDSTNHVPATGLTVTATRSIDGGSFASATNSVSAVANGTYKIDLSAADMNGDHIMLRFTATGADDLNIEIVTQP